MPKRRGIPRYFTRKRRLIELGLQAAQQQPGHQPPELKVDLPA